MDAVRLTFALLALLLAVPATAGAHTVGSLDLTAQLGYHSDPVGSTPDRMVTAALSYAEAADGLPMTWCGAERTTDNTANAVSPSAARVKVIYAYASDRPDRFAQVKDKLQANVSLLSRYVALQSGGQRTVRFDMGTNCGADYVDIQKIALPRPRASYISGGSPIFHLLDADVRAVVEAAYPGRVDWLVYADDMRPGSTSGTGQIYSGGLAETPSAGYHNDGRLLAAVWGRATVPTTAYADVGTMLHEITHNFGGVQPNSPHTTGNMHCNDELDVMCYEDGGPYDTMTELCPATNTVDGFPDSYDCGGDDYFSPNPAPGSYLDTHWNVYDVSFLGACADELSVACATTGPRNTTPAAPAGWRDTDYSVPLTGTDPDGAEITRYEWYVNGDSSNARTSSTAVVTGEGTFTLSHRVGSPTEWSAWRHEQIRIDKAAPTLTLSCPSGWQPGPAACSAAGTDSGSGVARIEYQLGAPIQSIAGASAQLHAPRDGAHAVRARAVDNTGRASAWAASTLMRDGADPTLEVACAPSGSAHRCVIAAFDDTGVSATYAIDGSAPLGVPVGPIEVPAGATLTAMAVDGSGRRTTRTVTMAGSGSTWAGRLPLTGGGKTLTRASVRVGADARGTLTVPSMKARKGRYRLRVCAPGEPCQTFAHTLRRAGRLPASKVAFTAPAQATRATVRLTVLRGRRTVTVAAGRVTVPGR